MFEYEPSWGNVALFKGVDVSSAHGHPADKSWAYPVPQATSPNVSAAGEPTDSFESAPVKQGGIGQDGTDRDGVDQSGVEQNRSSAVFVYRTVTDAAHGVIDDFVSGRDKIDVSALGTFIFDESVPRAKSLWTVREGDDLRLLGDISGVPHMPVINILLKNVTTLEAADVGAIGVLHHQTLDAKEFLSAVQLHLDNWFDLPDAIGTEQADRLVGTDRDNALYGHEGNDRLYGQGWNDHLYGEDGNDVLQGGDGEDLLDGGDGVDTADYSDHTKPIAVMLLGERATKVYVDGRSEDTLMNIQNITGGSGNDHLVGDDFANTLRGGSGWDFLFGEEGNDILSGGYGRDVIDGGSGLDTVDYSGRFGSVNVHLDGANWVTATIGAREKDELRHIENVIGGLMNDVLVGDDQNNILMGGGGADTLTGGAGPDVFVYSRLEDTKGDTITDFVSGEDIMDFSGFELMTFHEHGPRAYSVWTMCSGSDLKVLGDWDGDIRTHEIDITLQGVTSITAADLKLEADESGTDRFGIMWCQLDLFSQSGDKLPSGSDFALL